MYVTWRYETDMTTPRFKQLVVVAVYIIKLMVEIHSGNHFADGRTAGRPLVALALYSSVQPDTTVLLYT